jgi:hypothetical protein
MKVQYCILAAVSLAVLVGCDSGSEPSTGEKKTNATSMFPQLQPPPTAVTLTPEKRNTETPAPAPPVAADARAKYVALMDAKLETLDAKLDELSRKTESYKDDAKIQVEQALSALREQRSKLGNQFAELKSAGADSWETTKAGFESAVGEWEKMFESAKSKFS